MFDLYPLSYRVGAAPIVTLGMVLLALVCHWTGNAPLLWLLYATLPAIAVIHMALLFDEELNKLDAMFYALVHVPLAFVIWTFSLLHASGNSPF